jgi:hypothetical protein
MSSVGTGSQYPDDSASSPTDRPSLSTRRSNQSALTSMLTQRHRSILVNMLVLDVTSRFLCIGIALFVVFTGRLEIMQAVGGLVISGVVAVMWFSQRARWQFQLGGLEEVMSRSLKGESEQTYIGARYFLSPLRPTSPVRYEPLVWWLVVLSLLAGDSVVSGLGSHPGIV